MHSTFLKKAVPHIIAIVILLIIAVIYCQPALQGKVLNQTDIQGWRGMAQQSSEFKEQYGRYPYWTNSMFGGMPGYQIAFETPNKISIGVLHNYVFTLGLPEPINFFFLASVMAYFLFMVLRVNPWIGIMGALAYAYSTYDPVIIAVGHNTKMICIGYAPAVIASLLLIFKRRYILGTVLTALFAAMIIWQNHIQITYYTFVTALAIGIAFLIDSLRKQNTRHALTSAALALLAGAVALGVNTINIWPMNEYAGETMRGGRSELSDTTNQANKSKGGLDKDYAFNWSYGISETMTIIVPAIFGGSNGGNELKPEGSKFAEKLSEVGMPEENAIQYANAYAYWGTQPSTSGPVYLGAAICFLFILGMVFLKGWIKWGIFAACIFAIILSWGKNLAGINYVLFDYLPLYNKFRAPTMALVIPQLGFVMIAGLTVQEILFGNANSVESWKKFRLAAMITGGIFVILILMYLSFDYTGNKDTAIRQNFANSMMQQSARGQQPTPQMQQQADEFARSIMNSLEADRQSLFGKDLFRSLFYIIMVAGAIGLYLKNKIKPVVALVVIVFFSSIDLLAVGRRYLNKEDFVEPADFESAFVLTPADSKIKSDPDKHYRVFDQTPGDPFGDSRAAYHHNSIGGYSPAKLALYQDIIQRQLSTGNMQVFNMLNTKYFITANPTTGQPDAQINPGALGNVWFVKGMMFAKNADEEMNALNTLNTKNSVVIDARYRSIAGTQPVPDSTASIRLVENLNDKITYQSSSRSNQFAVFSEVYYPHGWEAYVDGKRTDYMRVNYVLRGMPVPAGNHTIEFKFQPRSVILGDKITMWLSILLYAMLITGLVLEFRRRRIITEPVEIIQKRPLI